MNALDCIVVFSDSDFTITVREYLRLLLTTLWKEGEGFSGKRPFGNSGWDMDLYAALGRGGMINGEFDEDGYLINYDEKKANELIYAAIDEMCGK